MTKKIALIDGYGFVFRAFHSLPPLTRNDGTPVGAVYGFTNMLIKLLAGLDVSHLAVVFDAGSKTFRNDIYSEYKANRPPCPEELLPQFPIVREAAESLNLAILEKAGFEADDIIATLAKDYSKKDYEVLIVSSDKDLMQLVDDKVMMYDAMRNRMIGEKEVKDKFQVGPDKVLDVLSLMGDASDNVPGVRGIGPKTAAELIHAYGDLDGIFANLDKIKQKKRKEYLENGEENAKLSKTLITLKDDVEIGLGEDDLEIKNIEPQKLLTFLQEQGFRSLVERVKKEFEVADDLIENVEKTSKKSEKKTVKKDKKPDFKEIKKIRIEKEEGFLKLIEKVKKTGFAVVDFEENFNQINEITISTLEKDENLHEIYYFELGNSVKIQKKADLFDFDEKQTEKPDNSVFYLKKLAEIFADEEIQKIFFNSKRFMRYFLDLIDDENFEFKAYDDVSLMNHLLNSSIRNSFESLVDKNFSENFESEKLSEIHNLLSKSKEVEDFAENQELKLNYYCFKNYSLLKLYKILLPELLQNKLATSYYSYERPILYVLAKMENFGIKIDANKLGVLSKDFEEKISILTKEIYEITGEEFNIASPKQLSEILFDKMGIKSSKKSKKTGALSTKSSVLEELVIDGHEIAEKILDFRHFSKLKNTYTDSLPKEIYEKTGRVHSHFSTINTVTGRLSSSNPNLQNIPIKTEDGRKIRKCFVAKEGHKLISADYSQVELRVIAHVAKIDSLIKAFKADKDIHKITAAEVFQVSEDQVTKELRSKAKAINFGIIYGISAFGLAKQLRIPRFEAAEYIKNYLKTYPGIEGYMHEYQEFARENGFVNTIGGRKCFVKEINSKNHVARSEAERLAINAPIQGSAADIIKKAMIKLNEKLPKSAKMILQIHDELIIEAPKNEADEIAKIVKKEMESAMILDCPLKVDVAVGDGWK